MTSARRPTLASLERAATRATGARHDEELRDAVIQRFEYSYELSWKMMRRVLAAEAASPSAIASWSFRDLFREAELPRAR